MTEILRDVPTADEEYADKFGNVSELPMLPDEKFAILTCKDLWMDPASTGHNFEEIHRVIHSLQLTAEYSVATAVDWKYGDECVTAPALRGPDDLKVRFPKAFRIVRPYLRLIHNLTGSRNLVRVRHDIGEEPIVDSEDLRR